MTFLTIIGGAMLIALVAGILLGITWPVPAADDIPLPADHPLQVLPGTRIIDGGEWL